MLDSKQKERAIPIEIYTDGSLKKINNITFGGWAFIATKDNQDLYTISGQENSTTNQRMELTAVLKALEWAKEYRKASEKVIIFTDSAYIVNCYLQEWYLKWIKNGWINSSGQEVANQDLWIKILPFFDNFWYDFRKVKGHDNNFWNERSDKLAQAEAQNLKDNWRGKDGI